MNKERKIFVGMIAGLLAGIVVGLMVDKAIFFGILILWMLLCCWIGLIDRLYPKYLFINTGWLIGMLVALVINYYFLFWLMESLEFFATMILTLLFIILTHVCYKE